MTNTPFIRYGEKWIFFAMSWAVVLYLLNTPIITTYWFKAHACLIMNLLWVLVHPGTPTRSASVIWIL